MLCEPRLPTSVFIVPLNPVLDLEICDNGKSVFTMPDHKTINDISVLVEHMIKEDASSKLPIAVDLESENAV